MTTTIAKPDAFRVNEIAVNTNLVQAGGPFLNQRRSRGEAPQECNTLD